MVFYHNDGYLPAFFCAAHRRFTASCIRLRPSGVSLCFCLLTGLYNVIDVVFAGRPGPRLGAVSDANNTRADLSRAIS